MESGFFFQETQQFLARYLHGLLRVDVIDHRKFRGGQRHQTEAAASCLEDHLLALQGQSDGTFFRESTQNIEKFAPRHRDIAGFLNLDSVAATNSTSRSVAVMASWPDAHRAAHWPTPGIV